MESLEWEADSCGTLQITWKGDHLLQFLGNPILPEEEQYLNTHCCSLGQSVALL